jgi:hypothetical protein
MLIENFRILYKNIHQNIDTHCYALQRSLSSELLFKDVIRGLCHICRAFYKELVTRYPKCPTEGFNEKLFVIINWNRIRMLNNV